MSVPEGVAWKLRRAARLSEAIETAIFGFVRKEPPPYRIDVRDVVDDNGRVVERSWWLEIVEQPPAVEWAGMTGELLHNLRSALDHLAYALCSAHDPNSEPPVGTEFPIFAHPERFDDTRRGGGLYKIRGMSPEMQAAIRDEQPFVIGERMPKAQSIWLLHGMSNIDKHRDLHIAYMAGSWTGFTLFEDPDVTVVPIWSPEGEVARARVKTPAAAIRTEPVFMPEVVFDEGSGSGHHRPVDAQLNTFVRVLSEVVQRLSGRFLR